MGSIFFFFFFFFFDFTALLTINENVFIFAAATHYRNPQDINYTSNDICDWSGNVSCCCLSSLMKTFPFQTPPPQMPRRPPPHCCRSSCCCFQVNCESDCCCCCFREVYLEVGAPAICSEQTTPTERAVNENVFIKFYLTDFRRSNENAYSLIAKWKRFLSN